MVVYLANHGDFPLFFEVFQFRVYPAMVNHGSTSSSNVAVSQMKLGMNENIWKASSILVGGLEHGFYFPFHIWDVILPIDELIFFRGVETTNQYKLSYDGDIIGI